MLLHQKSYNVLYWLWLSLAVSPGQACGDILLSHFNENPEQIYKATKEDYLAIGKLSEETIEKLQNKSLKEAEEIKLYCEKNNIGILTLDNVLYPKRLYRIPRKPFLLYYKGSLPDIDDNVLIATVGTRRITDYGRRQAYTLGYDLARGGAIVVSGMAKGIDAMCHRGALDAGGHTIAVLGCEIDRAYPYEHKELMNEISLHGTVITEFKPFSEPNAYHFPIRNRIISGLCQGTLVIEADSKSGALITAKEAHIQGRDVFALPGMVGEKNSNGTNKLIQDGAIPVVCAEDILKEYEFFFPHKIHINKIAYYRTGYNIGAEKQKVASSPSIPYTKSYAKKTAINEGNTATAVLEKQKQSAEKHEIKEQIKQKQEPINLDGIHREIYELILTKESISADEICRHGFSISKVMTSLTILEMKGYVISLAGGRYKAATK